MTKKLILLMLLIPIIVMIGLFAATKTISIVVDVPVSGITFSNTDEHIYLDLDKKETVTLDYAVYPTNAKNKTATASTEAVKGSNLASLDFAFGEKSVTVTPKSSGSAKVFLTTADGGYRASVTVHVMSERDYELKSMESFVEKDTLEIGESVEITHKFNPENPTNSNVEYSSSNPNVVYVNEIGVITALRSGAATITVTAESNPEIYNVLTITVYENSNNNIHSAPPTFSPIDTEGKLPAYIPSEIETLDLTKFSLRAYSSYGEDISDKIELAIVKENGSGHYSITYRFKDEEYSVKYDIEVTYDDGTHNFEFFYKDLEKTTEDKIALDITFKGGNEDLAMLGSAPGISFTVSPVGAKCNYSLSTGNSAIVTNLAVRGQNISYTPTSVGVTTITLKATLQSNPSVFTEKTVTVYVSPREFNVTAPSAALGTGKSEDIFTIGKYEYVSKSDRTTNANETNKKASSDTTVTTTHDSLNKLVFDISFGGAATDSSFRDNITWDVGPEYSEYVYVDANGILRFRDNTDTFDGIVEVYAVFGPQASRKQSNPYEIRCVANGINVYSYLDLYRATVLDVANGNTRDVVLRSNVKEDFGYYVNAGGERVAHYTEIETTYDKDYYRNIGKENEAKVKVLIEFKCDVFGNGYMINAHNLTLGLLDNTGSVVDETLFKGPLNFVAMSDTNSSSAISVKAQDNISFALYENAKLNNVNLHGAEPDETSGLDLVDLNYAGTVVEILGDNVSIEHSRIRYGRTVIRAFGDVENPDKKIHIDITNTLLSEAREFIIRMGSNRFVNGSYESTSPALPGAEAQTHTTKARYNNLSAAEREDYDNKFINTFITVADTEFKNTGLFAIGVDSHFASHSLANGNRFVFEDDLMANMFATDKENKKSFLDSWLNLSKTSYGAKIKFGKNVNLNTWKPLEDVNSDTLIETPKGVANLGKFSELVDKIRFDVKQMVKIYNRDKLEEKAKIIYVDKNNKEYVHGGLVFFGGGKNYGVFDSTEANISGLNSYQISLSDVDSKYLEAAAGNEPFYFYMFDKNSYPFK